MGGKLILLLLQICSSLGKYFISYFLLWKMLNIPTVLTKDVKYFDIFLSGFPGSQVSGSDLLEMTPELDQDSELACRGAEVITCNVARVNWEVVMKKENILN